MWSGNSAITSDMSQILVILGMHRSGTSFAANWLQASGLFIGDNLMPADKNSNPKGHFEDVEFVLLQKKILSRHGIYYLLDQEQVVPNELERQEARQLIQKRSAYSQWGWKDPRTCLLLDMWHELIPEAYYLVLYRPADEVISSLYRRNMKQLPLKKGETKAWFLNKLMQMFPKYYYNRFALSWCRYNEDILRLAEGMSDKSRIVALSLEQIIHNEDKLVSKLINDFDFKLTPVAIKDCFDEQLMTRDVSLPPLPRSTLKRIGQVKDSLERLSQTTFPVS